MSGGREQSRYLRNNSTYPEVKLWNHLKQDQIGFMFKRQWLFDGYILDFYCSQVKLAVEVDGKIHLIKQNRDAMRDRHLQSEGITVLHVSARSVLQDCAHVALMIKAECERLAGHFGEQDRS